MVKTLKPKPKQIEGSGPSARYDRPSPTEWRRLLLRAIASVAVAITLIVGFLVARRSVEKRYVMLDRPPEVELVNRPAWMSDLLAEQIVRLVRPADPHPATDRQLLVDRVALLRSSPWVKDVRQVRRVYRNGPGDTLLIDCDWRAPAALVQWRHEYRLVDRDGVLLPETYSFDQLPRLLRTSDGKTNLRIIEDVERPPPAVGMPWPGKDVKAGIELAAALAGHDWTDEIERVNVSNFAGRIDPRAAQLTLITRYNTELRWGRPINATDFYVEIPWQQKLERLKQIRARYGRIDAGAAFVELRFDRIEVPAEQTAANDTPPR